MTPGTDIAEGEAGYVGRIPVRNLWLLMLYASDLLRMHEPDLVDREEMPDKLPDLIAEILARAVERRQRRNLSRAYEPRRAVLVRVRGRIDILATERRQLLKTGKVACRFDDLTIDTLRNRYVHGALDSIARLVNDRTIAHRCRKLARAFRNLGVTGVVPTRSQMSTDRFGRHDADDRSMVAAARLAFDLALLNESAGNHRLPVPQRDEHWVRILFQKAVGGFYKVHLESKGWRVRPGRSHDWPVDEGTVGAKAILPGMETDITLQRPASGGKIVVDTKFTDVFTKGRFGKETLKSDHLFQLYTYVRSQPHHAAEPNTDGLLLYASLGPRIDEAARVQGHVFRFATVNLAGSANEMRDDLLRAIEPIALS